ncbi:MAG: hypothetical protein V4621_08010 [Pseudomonadota bacterium]
MAIKKITAAIPMMDEKKWQAEDDMRTLARAKEIEADRARLAAAKRIAEQKIKEMQSVVAKKTTPTARKK